MCDVIIPALLGVAALGLLGGGMGGSCSNATVTIPQEVGDVTHGVPVSADYGYEAQQYAYAPPQEYYAQQAPVAYNPAPGYAATQGYAGPAPAPAYGPEPAGYGYPVDSTVGGSINYDGQSAVGAGVGVDDGGVGLGANVGPLDAGVGVGSGGIGANVGGLGVGVGSRSY